MAFLQFFYADGSPASDLQVIIKNPGHWDYGLTDSEGQVCIPHAYDVGTVVVNGKAVYMGDLSGTIYLP
ncbi:MAG: hypothetical protein R8P61_12770 [Bacteroidia bacterium]|nr:hypothetical protein [Bacteroidia bacterium]